MSKVKTHIDTKSGPNSPPKPGPKARAQPHAHPSADCVSQSRKADLGLNRSRCPGLADRLRRMMLEYYKTNSEFARALDVQPTQVSSWTSETGGISAPWLARIALVTGISLDWLILGEGEPRFRAASRPQRSLEQDVASHVASAVTTYLRSQGELSSDFRVEVDGREILRRAVTSGIVAAMAALEIRSRSAESSAAIQRLRRESLALGVLLAGETPPGEQGTLAHAVAMRLAAIDKLAAPGEHGDREGPTRIKWCTDAALLDLGPSPLQSVVEAMDATGDGIPTHDRAVYQRALNAILAGEDTPPEPN